MNYSASEKYFVDRLYLTLEFMFHYFFNPPLLNAQFLEKSIEITSTIMNW
jgi:hypothetical protein